MATYRKLGRETSHRNLMLRNLVTDLLRNGRIETTVTRAKETRRMAEKMITLAKRGDLHARRQVLAYVMDETVVNNFAVCWLDCASCTTRTNSARSCFAYSAMALSISETRDNTTSSLIRCCVVQSFPTGTLLYWEQVY